MSKLINIDGVEHYTLSEARTIIQNEEYNLWSKYYAQKHMAWHMLGNIEGPDCKDCGRSMEEQFILAGYSKQEDGSWTKNG